MPKKENMDKNKEKMLNKIAVKLKKIKDFKIKVEPKLEFEEHEEESELEEDAEALDDSNLNLQDLEFHQFMNLTQDSTKTGAPVLERIAGSIPRPIFVGGIPRETGANIDKENGNGFKYVPGAEESQETKYFSETGVNVPERFDLTNAGRTNSFREEISQERFFRPSEPRIESQNIERFERPERFDAENAGRRNLFERPEAKYEKYRPKLPKS